MTTTTTNDKRLRTLGSGRVVVKARDRHIFGAWLLDWSILLVLFIATYFSMINGDALKALVTALLVWPVGAFIYGLACCYRRTLGQTAAGTRTVRLDNGQIPGFWRSGWVTVVRLVLYPFVFSLMLVSALGGASPSMGDAKDRHMSIDDRATAAL